jgi:hypothetical protein
MGLLDEAIREHLDLKRRRGADPGEVQRDEREALGPVRRGPETLAQIEPVSDDPYLHDQEQQWEEESAEGAGRPSPVSAEAPEGYGGQPPDEESPVIDAPPPRSTRLIRDEQIDHARLDSDAPVAEASGAAPAPHAASEPPIPAEPAPQLGEETAEYKVGPVPPGQETPSDDMLEETPEFLQDTPDHDRLWFEQRPPRDFDFEG